MSFLKKIFGSKEKQGSESQPQPEHSLESYKEIPWMTEARLENIARCLDAGFLPARSLPTELDHELRPALEIAKRLNAIKALVLWLMVPQEHLEDEMILSFVEKNELREFMIEEETAILDLPRDDEEGRNMIGWKFENAWPLAWYFGYSEPDFMGEMITGEQMQEILQNHSCPLDENIVKWVQSKKTISEEALMKKEDLFYCLHNAVRSAQMGQKTVPNGFDPMGNGGVIHERRHSLTWMLSKDVSWDDTELGT